MINLTGADKMIKEFLVKHVLDGSYHLVTGCASSVADGVDAIEVPDGADAYVYYSGERTSYFYKLPNFIYKENKWADVGRGWSAINAINGNAGNRLWKREALNDKVSSVGAGVSSAWDTQVGGSHYKQFKIQPMQFALENKLDAAQQNVIKYIMRHSFKNGKQDLEKAKHYIDLMIEFYYGEK